MMSKRVCVIGAGIAGLVTAKVLREDGFDVTVYEKEPTVGGVWAESRTYPGLRANDLKETYAFSDFPYPADADTFPRAEQIRRYLNSYADHFGLRRVIRTSTTVKRVRRAGEGFAVTVEAAGGGSETEAEFDFVAVCNGVFSEPVRPAIPGAEAFAGGVLHSSEVRDGEALRGKRVVVVGGAKSALDCAVAAGKVGESCTVVVRRPHWMMPRWLPGGVRPDRLMGTRMWAQSAADFRGNLG